MCHPLVCHWPPLSFGSFSFGNNSSGGEKTKPKVECTIKETGTDANPETTMASKPRSPKQSETPIEIVKLIAHVNFSDWREVRSNWPQDGHGNPLASHIGVWD